MELDKISPCWFTDVGHKVTYDTWEQYLLFGENLEKVWKDFILFTWGCQKLSETEYMLQVTYINPSGKPRNYAGETNVFCEGNYLERAAVEVKFRTKDIEKIRAWLIQKNPDPWALLKLSTLK